MVDKLKTHVLSYGGHIKMLLESMQLAKTMKTIIVSHREVLRSKQFTSYILLSKNYFQFPRN